MFLLRDLLRRKVLCVVRVMSDMDPLGGVHPECVRRHVSPRLLVLLIVGRSGSMASNVGKSTLFATRSTPLRGRR